MRKLLLASVLVVASHAAMADSEEDARAIPIMGSCAAFANMTSNASERFVGDMDVHNIIVKIMSRDKLMFGKASITEKNIEKLVGEARAACKNNDALPLFDAFDKSNMVLLSTRSYPN
jgi:hypothetical protein